MSDSAPRAPRRSRFAELLGELPVRIGEIQIERDPAGEFVLRHRDDEQREGLLVETSAEAAAELARYDDAGVYRPLKTAPNLKHGWALSLSSKEQVRLAVDLFYPGRIAAHDVWIADELKTTPFRSTLGRQSGMYRAAAKITEEQADKLIGNFCRSDGGCLRTILWKRDSTGTPPSKLLPPEKYDLRHDQTGRSGPTIPLLCQEICNLLVAAARETVKTS